MSPLEQRLAALLAKRQAQSKLRVLKSTPPGSIDFSSNDFLSLSSNAAFRDDYLKLLDQDLKGIGSTGSRLLDGNSHYAEQLERDIAAFHGAEAGLLTNSGFDANVSIFAFLPQVDDVIIYDELIHASVHDGMRQSRAKNQIPFKHNDIDDLGEILRRIPAAHNRSVFIAVEAVYSMDGDVAPLTEIVDLIDTSFPCGSAHMIVDEAHSTGVYGPNGSGRVCELGLEKRVSIRLHTFGKALAGNGAIVLCSPIIRSYLINYARPLIYTTFMAFPTLVAIKNAYSWLKQGKTVALAANLYFLIGHLYNQLQTLRELNSPSITLPNTCPDSPIFAILSPEPRSLAAHCQSAGFIVRPVVAPTVPAGTERVRVCLHAGNTVEQIDSFVRRVKEWVLAQAAAPSTQAAEPGKSAELRLQAKI